MRKHIWLLSGLLVLAATAPSRADFTVRLGGIPATDVPFQTLVDDGEATVDPTHGRVRVAVGAGARVGVGAYHVAAGHYRPYYHGGYARHYGGYHYGGYHSSYYSPYRYGGYHSSYYRPYYYGGYHSTYYRPYYYGGYHSTYYRPYYYGGHYSSYCYPSSYYYDPYYYNGSYGAMTYGSSYYSAPPNGYSSGPVMPPAPEGDGTYRYDGGPRINLPYPSTQPALPSVPQPKKTIPVEGRVVSLTSNSPAPAYPAYGEDPVPKAAQPQPAPLPATTRVVSLPARITYPAYGDPQAVRTVLARSDSE